MKHLRVTLAPLLLSVALAIGFASFVSSAQDLPVPSGGQNLTANMQIAPSMPKEMGSARPIGRGWSVQLDTPNKNQPFIAQMSINFGAGRIEPGEYLLAVIKARMISPQQGDLHAKIQLQKAPYTSLCADTSVGLTTEWQELPLLFRVTTAADAAQACLLVYFGDLKQQFEIEYLSVTKYPQGTDVSLFPKLRRSYPGRQMDAPWRKQALARIETERKKNLGLRLLDSNGKPLANQEVMISLKRHEFGFGSAVPASLLVADSNDAVKFRNIVDRYFSQITFENDLKDMFWSKESSPYYTNQVKDQLNRSFEWLAQRNISVRGHYLYQIAKPPNLDKVMDPALIRQHFIETAQQRLDFVNDRVVEWDAINHPIAWVGANMLSRVPELKTLDREILKLAYAKTKLPIFVNEDQIFRPGKQCDDTYDYIVQLKQEGFRIDGLGNQAHFDASFLPSMEQIWEVTDRYAKIVPKQAITEYDINAEDDEELASDYTRDLLIATFSHPAYHSFIFWGFWEGSHWKKECASWNKNWTIRGRGKVIEEWLGKRWKTELRLKTNAAGEVTWRGFPGWYELSSSAIGSPVQVNCSTANPQATFQAK